MKAILCSVFVSTVALVACGPAGNLTNGLKKALDTFQTACGGITFLI